MACLSYEEVQTMLEGLLETNYTTEEEEWIDVNDTLAFEMISR
jgi:hypothetical protein